MANAIEAAVETAASPVLTYIKVGVVVAIATAAGLAYWHYRSVVADLDTVKAANATLTVKLADVAKLANDNAAAALQADKDRQAAVDALEIAQAGIDLNNATSRDTEAAIRATPAADDGTVATVLEALRKSRFGGSKK